MGNLSFWQTIAVCSFGFAILGFILYGLVPPGWPDPKRWKRTFVFCLVFIVIASIAFFVEFIPVVVEKTNNYSQSKAWLINAWIMFLALRMNSWIYKSSEQRRYDYICKQTPLEFGIDEKGSKIGKGEI